MLNQNKRLSKNYVPIAIKWLISFFCAVCILLLFLILSTSNFDLTIDKKDPFSFNYQLVNLQESSGVQGILIGTHGIVVTEYDYRARVFDLYFKANGSPLFGYGQSFIDACAKYQTPKDCTLLPAIAKVETDLCKTDISSSQYNCWGFGGSGRNRIIYSSFDRSIDEITRRLVEGYGLDFFRNPEAGELFYCGSHCDRWGENVITVQNELKQFALQNGYSL